MTPTSGAPRAKAAYLVVVVIFGLFLGTMSVKMGVLAAILMFRAAWKIRLLRWFRIAVTPEPDGLLCRYVPWQEPRPTGVVLAGTWFAMVLARVAVVLIRVAFEPPTPPVFAVVGVALAALIALMPLVVVRTFLRGYPRCFLRITPTSLRLPDPGRDWAVTDIPREQIQSIASATEPVGFATRTPLLLTEITYRENGCAPGVIRTVLVGPVPAKNTVWLTVKPAPLLDALRVWKDGDPHDPQLLDRVDAVLREQIGTGFGTEIVYTASAAYGVLFAECDTAAFYGRIARAVRDSTTWGEFRQSAPKSFYEEAINECDDVPDDREPFPGGRFHYDGANGWYPGGWPTEDELRWFPDDLIDKYGGVIEKYNGTADHTGLHYDQLYFPGDVDPDAIAADLRDRGYEVQRIDSGDLADWLEMVGA